MRIFKPSRNLNNNQTQRALQLTVRDGICSEAMVTLTAGTFLTAFALKLGATGFQIGILAAIPTLANLFPFLSIWLLRKLPNRKVLTVAVTALARIPLLLIGLLPFILPAGTALLGMILLFFIHQSLGAVAGTIWTSWMKDVVPSHQLGSYFSKRSRIITFISLLLSLVVAGILDYIKTDFSAYETATYSMLFVAGGLIGLTGLLLLTKTPEPQMKKLRFRFGRSFKQPLVDKNYRKLLIYQSVWTFASNLAVPFYTVYQLTLLKFPVSMVIIFSIVNQLAIALFVKIWGMYSDRFSNKTILKICSPVYLACMLLWTYTSTPEPHLFTIPMVALLHFVSGACFAGINLALTNISIKLAPKENTVSYISAKAMVVAIISGIAPLIAGIASTHVTSMHFTLSIGSVWLADLSSWDFFFILAALVGTASLFILKNISEEGEGKPSMVIKRMYRSVKTELRFKKLHRKIAQVRKLKPAEAHEKLAA